MEAGGGGLLNSKEIRGDWGRFGLRSSYVYGWKVLAGVVGFEPTIFSTKNCCLTTWPHPISERRSSASLGGAQGDLKKKTKLFLPTLIRPPKTGVNALAIVEADQDSALARASLYRLMCSANL